MEDFRDAVGKVRRLMYAWCEWGVLSLYMMFCIPWLIMLVAFLIALPFILIVYGLASPLITSLYIFAVMAGVGVYCIKKYFADDVPDEPIAGRRVLSEDRAIDRSRSILKNSRPKRR